MLILREVTLLTKSDHQKTVDDFKYTLEIEEGYHDVSPTMQKFGLTNAVCPIGTKFVEIMCTIRDDTPAGKHIQRRGGDSGYMIVAQTDSKEEYDQIRSRALEMGIRINWEAQNKTTNHLQLHPKDTGGAFFMVDWDSKNELTGNFDAAGGEVWKSYVRTDLSTDITAAEFQVNEPEKAAACWSQFLNLPYSKAGEDIYEIAITGGAFRFVPISDDQGAGLCGLDVCVKDLQRAKANALERGLSVTGDTVTICRTKVHLIEKAT